MKITQGGTACGLGHSHGRVGSFDGDSPFEALPTRVRQRLKSQPRTTRAGTGKARIVACLDEEEGARSFRRRKPSQRPKAASTDNHVDGGAPRFEQDFHGRKTREAAKSTAKAMSRAMQAKAARNGDDLDAGRLTHAPKSRVVGGRRVAPSRHRASPSGPATPEVNGSHPRVPANLAAAGFSPFKAVRRPRPGSEFRHTAWEQTGCYQPCKDMFEALGREVRDYVSYRNTCMAVLAPRVEAEIQALRRVVVSTFDWCSLEVYGSFASGLWLPGSDVDLVALALTQGVCCAVVAVTVAVVVYPCLRLPCGCTTRCCRPSPRAGVLPVPCDGGAATSPLGCKRPGHQLCEDACDEGEDHGRVVDGRHFRGWRHRGPPHHRRS